MTILQIIERTMLTGMAFAISSALIMLPLIDGSARWNQHVMRVLTGLSVLGFVTFFLSVIALIWTV